MISSPMKSQFESVLCDQHLTDVPSCFAGADFFDEIPLYSRYDQIEFLKQYGDVDRLLIDLSLDYLDRVSTLTTDGTIRRFAAVTVIKDDGSNYLIPQIFVCNGDVERRLTGLQLAEPSKGLGKEVEELVRRVRPESDFVVFEDRSTVPGELRVFVGHHSPPHGFLALTTFATANAAIHAMQARV